LEFQAHPFFTDPGDNECLSFIDENARTRFEPSEPLYVESFWNERKEHHKTSRSLRVTKAKIAEQAAQIKKMRQLIQGAISEAEPRRRTGCF
jgi:hypothetical protein